MSNPGTNDSMDLNRAQSEATDKVTSKPGAQLAALRESKGWTVEQVASQLNLATRQVQAIESDNYDALPGMAVTRGFMRAYAKLLQVDPVPIISLLPGQAPIGAAPTARKALPNAPFPKMQPASSKQRRSFLTSWKAGLLLVIGIFAVAAVTEREDELSPALSELEAVFSPPNETPGSQAGPVASDNSAISQQEAGPILNNAAPNAPDKSASALASSSPLVATPAPPAEAASTATSSAEMSAEKGASAKNALVLKFREDSWIEIKRADDKLVVSRLAKAGSTETVTITQPVSVVIGNAAGVDAVWQGKALELKAGAKSNVARLDLK